MVEGIANKVTALIRGHLTRCRFKKLFFLHQVTGKIAHQFTEKELLKVPTSTV